MDDSTEGVTLLSGFVFDVLAEFEDMRRICAPAFDMAAHLDRERPGDPCPMQLYNDVCAWIENEVGAASIRRAGAAIGARAFARMSDQGQIAERTPLAIMRALQWAADTMIQDPKGRGWEILDHQPTSLRMRRTQTFNCVLQEGLLLSMLERAEVLMPSVEHVRCTRRGDEFCEYELRWLRR
ncbi:MAG: hypothetical protein AAGH15_01355 [Myxococcota bacterium]